MSYRSMSSSRAGSTRGLYGVGAATSIYSKENLQPPSMMDEIQSAATTFDDSVYADDYAPVDTSEEDKKKTMLYIGAGVAALVVVGGVAIAMKGKK